METFLKTVFEDSTVLVKMYGSENKDDVKIKEMHEDNADFGRTYTSTSVEEKFSSLENALMNITKSLSQKVAIIKNESQATTLEMEFSLSLQQEVNLWALKGAGEQGISIKLSWDLNK